MVEDQDDISIAPLTGPFDSTDPDQYDYITKAELETIELANRSTPFGVREWECEFWLFDGTCREYHVYGIVVNHYREKDDGTRSSGSMGLMYDPVERSAFVNYYKNSTNSQISGPAESFIVLITVTWRVLIIGCLCQLLIRRAKDLKKFLN